jgi:hypothetical protein
MVRELAGLETAALVEYFLAGERRPGGYANVDFETFSHVIRAFSIALSNIAARAELIKAFEQARREGRFTDRRER